MTIIKHGNCRGDTIEFTCACGCVFHAQDKEYKVVSTDDGILGNKFYEVNCPECGGQIVIEARSAKIAFEHGRL